MYPALKCPDLNHDLGNSLFHRQDHGFQMRLPYQCNIRLSQTVLVSEQGLDTLQMTKYSPAKWYSLTEGMGSEAMIIFDGNKTYCRR
jgi:CHASE1-domain containing sensor protein